MEDSAKPPLSKTKLTLYVAAGIVVVIVALIVIKLTNAPIAQLKAWEAQLVAENANPETAIEIIDNPRYDSIQRQIALRKALLSMPE